MVRKRTIAVVGFGGALPAPVERMARELGAEAVARGYRLMTGGLGGVMAAAARGAAEAGAAPGDVVAVVPGHDAASAHRWASVVIPTGLGFYRNGIVAHSDAVIAVGGGAGTLSEIALAWKLDRLVIAIADDAIGGWSTRLAGAPIDGRDRGVGANDVVHGAADAREAIDLFEAHISRHDNGGEGLDSEELT